MMAICQYIQYMKYQEDQIQDLQNGQVNERNVQTSKEKLDQYFQYSSLKSIQDFAKLKKQMISLLPLDIEYHESQIFAKNLIIKIVRHTKSYDFVDIQANLGYFRLKNISIMSIDEVSPLHNLCFNSRGSFGTVFNVNYKDILLAFKCFSQQQPSKETQSKRKNLLKNVISEYCILKICSALGVGPKLYEELGCNIIIYKNCVQFGMELCSKFTGQCNKIHSLTRNLKQNLAKLHCLNIIHSDLKLQNICFSHKYKKYVLIDYGFSNIISQQIGFRTKSVYKGSFTHSSDQMLKLFHEQGQAYIDLYYNDYHSIKLILNNVKYMARLLLFDEGNQIEELEAITSSYLSKYFFLNFLKYSLFHHQLDVLQKTVSQLSEQNLKKLCDFVANLKFSSKLNKIYNIFLSKANYNPFETKQISFVRLNFEKIQSQQKQVKKDENESLFRLNSLIDKKRLQYYTGDYQKNSKQLFQLLKDVKQTKNIPLEQYYLLVAKAVQIHSNRLSLQQLDFICQIAVEKTSFFPQLQKKQCYMQSQSKYLRLVSKFLFEKSIQKELNNNYFNIFRWTVTNIIVLGVFDEGQLVLCYESFLKKRLSFPKKVSSIIQFNAAFVWFQVMSTKWQQYESLLVKIDQIIESYLINSKQNYSKQQLQILSHILQRQTIAKTKKKILPEKIIQKTFNRTVFLQIMQWQLFKQFYSYDHTENSLRILSDLIYYSEQLSFGAYRICQFYHPRLLVYYLSSLQFNSVESTIKRIQMGLKICSRNISLLLRSVIILIPLKKKEYSVATIQNFIQNKIIQENRFFLINKQITKQLNSIRYTFKDYNTIFNQLKNRQYIFLLQLQTSKKCYYTSNENLYKKFREKIHQISLQQEIEESYFDLFYQKLIYKSANSSQQYIQLRNKAQIKLGELKSLQQKIRLVNLQIILLMIIFIKQQKYDHAAKLAMYSYRANIKNKDQRLSKCKIMEIIINQVISVISHKKDPQIKQKMRWFYFKYAQLVCQLQCQQIFFNNIGITIEIIQLMYKYQVDKILPLITRISQKLQNFNDRDNTQRYISLIEYIFRYHLTQEYFCKANLQLYYKKQLWSNPYNFIFAYNIYLLLNCNFHISHADKLYKLFKCIKFCNLTVHQKYKQKMLLRALQPLQKCRESISSRKMMAMYKKLMKYTQPDEIKITSKSLINLFMNKNTLKFLKRDAKKYKTMTNKFKQYALCLQGSTQDCKCWYVCTYNRIIQVQRDDSYNPKPYQSEQFKKLNKNS